MRPGVPWLAAAVVLAAPAPAAAHAFAERYDLPLPLGFYLAGAGLAVALSFLGSFLIRRPPGAGTLSVAIPVPPAVGRWVGLAVRLAALFLFAMVVATGLWGPESPTRNFATLFVWVIWWVGFVLFSALVTDLWSLGNPFRSLVDAALRLTGSARSQPLPAGAGWIAVAGLLTVPWIELVSDWSEDPRAVVVITAVYLGFLLAGSAWAGAASWFAVADPLTRLFGLLGHVAPLTAEPGRLRLRVPAAGLVGVEAGAPGAAFAVTLIAVVLFDGLSETPLWAGILEAIAQSRMLRTGLLELRGAGVDILKLIRTAGLFGTVLLAVLAYVLLTLAMWRAAGRTVPWARIFAGFAASLLPIAVAYHLAHYASYLALAGQLVVPIASDPFGLGWDLFGGANRRIDLGVIDARQVWWIAAGSLVTGHGLSVFVAHAGALRLFPDRRLAVRSQLPMMAFMVGLTALSLWILAQPIVA